MLTAAYGSHIATYGTREIRLDLGFRQMSWSFRLTTVTKPILGLDFLSSEYLSVNIQRHTLYAVARHTGGAGQGTHGNCAILHIDTPDHDQWVLSSLRVPQHRCTQLSFPHQQTRVFSSTGPPSHVHYDAFPQTDLQTPRRPLRTWLQRGSVGDPPVHTPPPFTWRESLMVHGGCVVITDYSMPLQLVTATPFLTSGWLHHFLQD